MASKAASLVPSKHAADAAAPVHGTQCSVRTVCWQDMEDDISAWDKLANDASEPNPFFESWYLLPALRALDTLHKVQILRFECDGILRGLMPVCRNTRYYDRPIPHIATWMHPNCFFGTPLITKGHEADFCRILLRWADHKNGFALFLHFAEIDLNGPFYREMRAALAANNRQYCIGQQFERALLSSKQSPDDYLSASLPKRKRHELQRQFNRLSEQGTVQFVWNDHNRTDWANDFLALEESGWKGEAGSALACNMGTDTLFRDALKGAAQRDRLITLSLLLDGHPIAMLANFITPPGSFGFKTAFNEEYSRYSPGVLLEREYLSTLTNSDIAWCDSCAIPNHPVMDRLWRERRTIGKVSVAIGGVLRRSIFSAIARLETARTKSSDPE